MKSDLKKEELDELEASGKLHFYEMLKSADKSNTDETPIKFNYFNIASKVKPELKTRLITEGIKYLEDKLDCLIYPYGHKNSHVLRYHPFDPPEPDKNEPFEYHHAKEFLPPKMFLRSQTFYTSETWQKIKEELRLDKELRKKVHSLLNLDRLKNHIENIIEEIKNSDLRNYADTHETELFQGGVIFKIYRGQEQIERLRAESDALEFFQKELPDLRTPRVYCYGELGDFYALLEEKIDGVTADKLFKKIKNNSKKKRFILERIIENLVTIHTKSSGLCSTYGKSDEQGYLEWLKNSFVVRVSNNGGYNTEKLELVSKYYKPIAKLLANYKIQVFNKDANLKNWVITDSHNSKSCYAIDFENTSIAPPQLDLVSILEDRNLRLNKKEKEEFKKGYIDKFNSIETNCTKIKSYEEFNQVYNAAIVHMNLVYTGFSSEKYSNSNKKKCKSLQLKSLTLALNSISWLLKSEVNQEEKERYNNLYNLVSYFIKEVQKL